MSLLQHAPPVAPTFRRAAVVTPEQVLRELAADGAWTQRQLEARLRGWGAPEPDAYLARDTIAVRPTAWAHRRVTTQIVRPNRAGRRVLDALQVEPQQIRPEELEHALGLAELRWRCEVSAEQYQAQDQIRRDHARAISRSRVGFGSALADGIGDTGSGLVLYEYDHGRYTTRQVLAKLAGFRVLTRLEGRPVTGATWGTPSERRAARLRQLGAVHVRVMPPETWLI